MQNQSKEEYNNALNCLALCIMYMMSFGLSMGVGIFLYHNVNIDSFVKVWVFFLVWGAISSILSTIIIFVVCGIISRKEKKTQKKMLSDIPKMDNIAIHFESKPLKETINAERANSN